MKKLSYWARGHRTAARILIIIFQLLLVLSALFIGTEFRHLELGLGWSFAVIAFTILITAVLVYPHRFRERSSSYVRHKTCDFLIAMSCSCLLCFTVNRNYTAALIPPGVYGSLPSSESVKMIKTIMEKYPRPAKPPRKRTALAFLLILAVIVGSFACLYGIAALACSLSCSGSVAMAYVVTIAGLAGVVTLAIVGIRAILRWARRGRLSIRRSRMSGAVTLR